jgi:pyruvate dehydrogenase complex dehydrogenase (E1) component
MKDGAIKPEDVAKAIKKYNIDTDRMNPAFA